MLPKHFRRIPPPRPNPFRGGPSYEKRTVGWDPFWIDQASE